MGAQRLRTPRPVTRARPRTRASAPHLQSALSSGLDEPSCVMNSAQSEHSSLKVEKPGKCQGRKVQKDKKSQEKVVQIGRGPPRSSRWLCYGTSDEFPDSGHLLIVTISTTPPSPRHHRHHRRYLVPVSAAPPEGGYARTSPEGGSRPLLARKAPQKSPIPTSLQHRNRGPRERKMFTVMTGWCRPRRMLYTILRRHSNSFPG